MTAHRISFAPGSPEMHLQLVDPAESGVMLEASCPCGAVASLGLLPIAEPARPAEPEPSAALPSFEELVQRYQRQVLAIAYRILGNWQDAEDLAQEALLKAYLRLGDLSNPSALGPWLRRLTVNACLDALARRQRRPATVSLTAPDDQEAPAPERALSVASAEDDAVRAEEWQDLRRTLSGLEPGAREALVLREIYGYSYAEIAEKLDLGLSAVKMRVHRARHAVQRAMSERQAVVGA